MHPDEATRQSEGIDAGIAYRKQLEMSPRFRRRLRQTLAQTIQVLRQHGIVEIINARPDLAHDLATKSFFIGLAQGQA